MSKHPSKFVSSWTDHILRLPQPILTTLSFVLFILLWWAGTVLFLDSDMIPSPDAVAFRAIDMFRRHDLTTGIEASMIRVIVGLVLGTVLGIALGLLIGRSRLIATFVDPVFQLLRNLSPTAMIPVALVWFGIGESSKYFLIFWGTFFIVAVNTTAGTRSTPQTRIRAAQCLGASEARIFISIILPSALPYIIAGIRLGVASAFMTIIPAELLAAQEGLGALLQQASLNGQIDRMFVVLVLIAVLGYGTDRAVRYLSENTFRRYTAYLSEM
ncbi:ABC transporter permease [Castellaniella sp.]|uniref:ABC transporter permease n=1 Tax=Castellaniella sp. TaxID=1955812 RepID=UPI003566F52A